MTTFAAAFGILFGAIHALPYTSTVLQPEEPKASGSLLAVPRPARIAWLLLNAVVIVGALALAVSATPVAVAMLIGGALGVWGLAIANGFWIKGRPSVPHHIVRAVLVAALSVAAVAAL